MNEIRGLSLLQPWATPAVVGAKRNETRSWRTKYRGRLAIHASKRFPWSMWSLLYHEPFYSAHPDEDRRRLGLCRYVSVDAHHDPEFQIPLGAIIGTVYMEDCVPVEDIRDEISETEYDLGDYSDGRFAWKFRDAQRLDEPIPCKGALGLWRIPDDVLERLKVIQ